LTAAVEEAPAADEGRPLDNLDTALARAQGKFPRIEKNNTATVPGKDGKQGYTYSYADLGDVLAAVRPILAEEGLALVQRTRPDNGKTKLVTELRYGATGEVLDSEIEIAAPTGNPQQFGGSLTYFRRYEAVTLLGVAAEEDLDAANVETVRNAPSQALPKWGTPLSQERARELFGYLELLVGADQAKALMTQVKEHTTSGIPSLVLPVIKFVADLQLDTPLEELEERREHARAVAAGDAEPVAEPPEADPAPTPAVDASESDVPPDMEGLGTASLEPQDDGLFAPDGDGS
jgi:hypothetical protein